MASFLFGARPFPTIINLQDVCGYQDIRINIMDGLILERDLEHVITSSIPDYRKIASIIRSESQNLNVSCLVFQLALPNPLKPGVESRMKM